MVTARARTRHRTGVVGIALSTALLCSCAGGGVGGAERGEARGVGGAGRSDGRLLPVEERGVTAIVVCQDTVDPAQVNPAVLDAIAQATAAGDEVSMRVGGPTATDFETIGVTGDEPDRPSDDDPLAFFLDRLVAALPDEVRTWLAGAITHAGLDLPDLVGWSLRWAGELGGGQPVRLLFFCTGLQRSDRGDILAGPVAVPTLAVAVPSDVVAIRFVGAADFTGVQAASVDPDFRDRVFEFVEGLCAQFEPCSMISTFSTRITGVWS